MRGPHAKSSNGRELTFHRNARIKRFDAERAFGNLNRYLSPHITLLQCFVSVKDLEALAFTKYVVKDGEPALMREPELHFFGDKESKPVAINAHIGRRPIAAFGNSDGDFAMLEWVTRGPRAGFGLIVHHDDADREYAYDRDAGLARLARGLHEGPGRGWTIVTSRTTRDRVFRSWAGAGDAGEPRSDA